VWIVRVALQRPYTFVVLALLILMVEPLTIARTPTDIFPNIDIPAGSTRLCTRIALTTSAGDTGAACSVRVQVDLDLLLRAAVRVRNLRALDARELRAQRIHADVEQLLLGELLARPACECRPGARGVRRSGGLVPSDRLVGLSRSRGSSSRPCACSTRRRPSRAARSMPLSVP